MATSRRKTAAIRAPSSLRYEAALSSSPGEGSSSHSGSSRGLATTSHAHHSLPPAMFSSPALQTLIYATSNDRFPGAPGTLLYRAKIEQQRALAASKREAQREAERRDEMKRLGILSVSGGRKRGSNGVADAASLGGVGGAANGNGRSSRFSTPPSAERARRSAAATTAAAASAAANGVNGIAVPSSSSSSSSTQGANNGMSRSGGRAAANGRNIGNAIDHNSLPVPGGSASQQHNNQQQPPSSPLLSASGRLRRPASASRGASPMPLTGAPGPRGARSPVVPLMDLEEGGVGGSALIDPPVVPAGAAS